MYQVVGQFCQVILLYPNEGASAERKGPPDLGNSKSLGLRVPPVALRVQVPNHSVLGFWVVIIVVQVLGKYMIIRYLNL